MALTPRGRAAVEARRIPDFAWVCMLLRGLDPAVMRETERILRVIRSRRRAEGLQASG